MVGVLIRLIDGTMVGKTVGALVGIIGIMVGTRDGEVVDNIVGRLVG
jgi:hypothetical protein